MALKDLTQSDFEFWKRYYSSMKGCHEQEFLREIEPTLMRAFYRGRRTSTISNEKMDSASSAKQLRERFVTLNRIFSTSNLILPSLYFQNPKKLAIPMYGTSPTSGALMTAVQNFYMEKTNQKMQNQESIMNAWFFGLGWKKVGYHTATEPIATGVEDKLSPEDKRDVGAKNKLGVQPPNMEALTNPQYVRFESVTNTAESPENVYIDHKGDITSFKVIAYTVPRSIHELETFGNYDKAVIAKVREKFLMEKGSRFDDRDAEVKLVELEIQQRNGIWILTFIEDFPEPLRYEKSSNQGGSAYAPLYFTYEPGVRYPVSHMKVASVTQAWVDNIVNLQLEVLGKTRNQHYLNRQLLQKGETDNFQKNTIGGIIMGNKTAQQGDIVPLFSQPIRTDMFNMLSLFQQNEIEMMGTSEQLASGKSKNDTATQDKIAAAGAEIRESGMVDRIRDWMISQAKKEGDNIKQYSNAELHLQITPNDFSDKETGKKIEDTWVEFGTPEKPLTLRHYLEGGEFDYSINVYEAIKISKPGLRREYMELLQALAPLQPQAIQDGFKYDLAGIGAAIGDTFELINSKQFIQKLTPEQQAAEQMRSILQSSGGSVPPQQGGADEIAQEEGEPTGG